MRCAGCGSNLVNDQLGRCPNCGAAVSPGQGKRSSVSAWVVVPCVIAAAVGALILSRMNGGSDRLTCSESFAYGGAKSIVEKQLQSPGSAQFAKPSAPGVTIEKVGNCRYRVTSYVDSQNGFGALLRTDFTLTVEGQPQEGYWQGSDLQMR